MKDDFLFPADDRKKILEEIGKKIVTLHQERIQRQIQVDRSAMPKLKPKTIKRKRKKGGQSARNAERRMMDTGDFMQNAFQYQVHNDSLKVGISRQLHKTAKTSYRTLALEQENSAFGRSSMRADHNPGANFFGLNENDFLRYRKMFHDMAIPTIKKNFLEYLNKAFKIK